MNTGPFLITLKYLGILTAAFSSIWSATNVISQEVEGRKQLTKAGKIAVGVTVGGLFVTLASTALQDYAARQASEAAAIAELKRTNRIILSGQPVVSLDLTWTFASDQALKQFSEAAHRDFVKFIAENAQGGNSASQGNAVYKLYELYPMMSALVRGPATRAQDIVFLLSLDTHHNAVLPFGIVPNNATWNFRDTVPPLPAAIDREMDLMAEWHAGGDATFALPQVQWNDAQRTVSISWNLDPHTFSQSLVRVNPATDVAAAFPDRITMLVIYNIKDLPFEPGDFSRPLIEDAWAQSENSSSPVKESEGSRLFGSVLTLTPNSLGSVATTYYRVRSVVSVAGSDVEFGEDTGSNFLRLEFARVSRGN